MKGYKHFFILIASTILLLLFMVPVSATEISGECGRNLTWTFDDAAATLTISGQGEMNFGEHAPWSDYRDNITTVVIEEGVTSVGRNAFIGHNALCSVSLPSSVTKISENAFHGCLKLQSISLSNVTVIDSYAFSNCVALAELTIPAGVTKIGWGAFYFCKGLETVQFHNNITEIDSYAFSECSALTFITIPDSVEIIGGSAFSNCYNLSSVTLSKNLTFLGNNAFSQCPNLKKITIPDGVKEIMGYTFSSCSALQEVVIGKGVSTISTTAFNGCYALTAFTLSSGNANFSVDRGVLYNASKTELLQMPSGFQGSYTVLSGTTKVAAHACQEVPGLTSVILPDSVTVLEDYAFCGDSGVASIKLSNNLQKIGTYSLSRLGISEIFIPASVTKINAMALYGCTPLSKITFAGNAPDIGDHALGGMIATAYYPGSKAGWKEAKESHKIGIEWVALSCEEHEPVTNPGKSATCTESGVTDGSYCSVCFADLVVQERIPAKGHSYTLWTWENADAHKAKCTACGKEKFDDHTWNMGTVTQKPTCQEPGKKTYTCTICNAIKTETLGMYDHTYDHSCDTKCNICDAERTIQHAYSGSYCCDEENHWIQCSVCGEKRDMVKHTPGAAATEEAPQTCTVCGFEMAPVLESGPAFETIEPSTETTDPDYPSDSSSDLNYLWWLLPLILGTAIIGIFFFLRHKKK